MKIASDSPLRSVAAPWSDTPTLSYDSKIDFKKAIDLTPSAIDALGMTHPCTSMPQTKKIARDFPLGT